MEQPNGILVVDKPAWISSAGVLTRLKGLWPRGAHPKLGHAGTLDPFATGVLLVLIGKATKRCEELMGMEKCYRATIKLGASTPTLDPTSAEVADAAAVERSRPEVEAVLPRFVGTIMQRPPAFSAIKRDGQSVYKLARRGHIVELEARPVTVYGMEMLDFSWPLLEVDIRCGRGTYVRSLARDIAEALGTTGHLTALRRLAVGAYAVENAVQFPDITLAEINQRLR